MHQFRTSPAWTLDGAGSLFADYLFKQIDAVFFAMFFLMSLLLLRFLFRKTLWPPWPSWPCLRRCPC